MSADDKKDVMIGFVEKVVVPFTVVVPFKTLVAVDEPMVSEPLVKLEPIVIGEVAVVGCIVFTYIVEAFNTEVFVVDVKTLFINVFTQAVVGILEELSVLDKEAFIF